MSRAVKNAKLDSRTSRLKLSHQAEPYWISLAPGRALGYHRPSSSGAGTWRCRLYDPETRKLHKHALGTADDFEDADGQTVLSFLQVQEKAQDWFKVEHHDQTGESFKKGPFTVMDAWEAYRRNAEREGQKGLRGAEGSARVHILPALGHIEVAKLTHGRIERWHEGLAKASARVRTKMGAKKPATRPAPTTDQEIRARRDTANRILTILKAALNFAKRRRLTSASGDAWREAKPFKNTSSSRIRFLSMDESKRLVNGADPEFRLLIQAALLTGCRYGELTCLQVRDYQPTSATLFVAESKSGRARHVVLTDEGKSFFESVTAGRSPDAVMFERVSYSNRNRFSPIITRAWKRAEQSRILALACKTAGLDSIRFHELRHTYASTLVNVGVPLAYVAEQLGHAGTNMVEKHYGHLCPSAKAESIRRLMPALGITDSVNVVSLKSS